ncbi:hypothetical protein HYPSUDRAFT_527516 [Hypholoma sublateritium FD-334 SS-4]|uniref:Uncharacterized protein n=1 Tax=Hypholoma sublateritium (strain FD-334 SS-4) TaxID=945553 RepID=A0A0D2LAX5_HYPSF|nr:hypothetical protein HYPSUDRAFT_527516 [Hypholoma sublateritium FD-334 SS-4]
MLRRVRVLSSSVVKTTQRRTVNTKYAAVSISRNYPPPASGHASTRAIQGDVAYDGAHVRRVALGAWSMSTRRGVFLFCALSWEWDRRRGALPRRSPTSPGARVAPRSHPVSTQRKRSRWNARTHSRSARVSVMRNAHSREILRCHRSIKIGVEKSASVVHFWRSSCRQDHEIKKEDEVQTLRHDGTP